MMLFSSQLDACAKIFKHLEAFPHFGAKSNTKHAKEKCPPKVY
jgi:hypothetical protein